MLELLHKNPCANKIELEINQCDKIINLIGHFFSSSTPSRTRPNTMEARYLLIVLILSTISATAQGADGPDALKMDGSMTSGRTKVILTMPRRNITFLKIGSYGGGLSYGHLFSFLNLTDVLIQYNRLVARLDEAYISSQTKVSRYPGWAFYALNDTMRIMHTRVRDVEDLLAFSCALVQCSIRLAESSLFARRRSSDPSKPIGLFLNNDLANSTMRQTPVWGDPERPRYHRQIAAILSGISAGLSIYTLSEVQTLKRDLSLMKDQSTHIAERLDRDHTILKHVVDHFSSLDRELNSIRNWNKKIEIEVGLMLVAFSLDSCIDALEIWLQNFVSTIVSKQVSPRFFDPDQISQALLKMQDQAAQYGLSPVSRSITDVTADHVSFLASTDGVFLIIHIPLMRSPSLSLYRYVNTPISLVGGGSATVVLAEDLIATNEQTTEYVLLSPSELDMCSRRKDITLCPTGVTRKKIEESCIGALFVSNVKQVEALCSFFLEKEAKETVTQVAGDTAMIYGPPEQPVRAYISCNDGDNSFVTISGHKAIRVPEHCVLSTERYIFQPMRSFDVSSTFIVRPLDEFNFNAFSDQVGDTVISEQFDTSSDLNDLISDLKNTPDFPEPADKDESLTWGAIIWAALLSVTAALVLAASAYVVHRIIAADKSRRLHKKRAYRDQMQKAADIELKEFDPQPNPTKKSERPEPPKSHIHAECH